MRIILDIEIQNSVDEALTNVTDALSEYTVSAVCIDETNDNQFHNDLRKNVLSREQLQRFHDYCHQECVAVRMHDRRTGWVEVVSHQDECEGEVEKTAYNLCVSMDTTISIGDVVAEHLTENKQTNENKNYHV